MSVNPGRPLPERTILTLLRTGVQAILDDLGVSAPGETVLDDILCQLDDEELAKARTYYTDHAPSVIMGYARTDAPFPLFALTLTSDTIGHDYLALEGNDVLDANDVRTGRGYARWTVGKFTIFVYADHPDICAWYYRILRRICNVGSLFLISQGLDNPKIDGAELAPDPRFAVDNMFIRRLTLTVEYDEHWDDTDALWRTINAQFVEEFITDPSQIDVRHEASGGRIRPRFDIATVDD